MSYDSSDKPGSNELDRNPDPLTGAPGSHPLGTGIGTGSGALTGAAMGALGGPVGAAIGLIAGGIVGAIAGHKAGEYNDPTEDFSRTGEHADPVARATNPTPTSSVTTSGQSAGSSTDSSADSSATGSSMTSTDRTASRSATLDSEDAEYWRSTHKTQPYASESADFEDDYVPAYGFGTEISRQAATTGAKADFSELDTHARTGWDHVRGSSKLSYDQAKPAIEDAYNRTLRLHEERLNVSKDRVETGSVSLRKEIITEQKQIEVLVEREEIVITTRAISGEGATAGAVIGEGQEIRVPVSEERVNVTKDVVPTGEVRLDKKIIQDTKSVVDNIRKETVKVDKTGDVKVNEETASGGR